MIVTRLSVALYGSCAALAFLAASLPARAAVINVASPSLTDVRAAVAQAVDGDVVVLPPGSASWTETLTVNKRISIMGATIITGDHDHLPMTAHDLTIIIDDVALTGGNQVGKIIEATISPGTALFRISGISFRHGGAVDSPGDTSAAIVLLDSSTQTAAADHIRIDHCHFDQLRQHSVFISGWMYPVIDHCIHDGSTGSGSGPNFCHINMPTFGGNAYSIGNYSYYAPSYWGSEKFVFMEDNQVTNPRTVVSSASVDAEHGARYVARYNVWYNTQPHQHGTETGGYRSARAMEIYGNQFNYTTVILGGDVRRGGTGLVWGNNWTAAANNPHIMSLTVYREFGCNWLVGGAYGGTIWDVNDASDQTGNGYGGGPEGLYASGTHTGGSNSSVLTVSGTPWVGKDWTGYEVTNLDQINSNGFAVGAYVLSNTANTITLPTGSAGTAIKFNPGDRYEIKKCLVALDQPGRGSGDRCVGSGVGQFHRATGPDIWPHEALEPWYCWGNSFNGTLNDPVATINSGYPTLAENRDYYNFNPTWSPGQPLTAGIASGTLAHRPTQCTPGTDIGNGGSGPGVAYWATDEQKLYVAAGPNTWTLYYTPYTYPHPLVSGAPVPPTAPVNLRILP